MTITWEQILAFLCEDQSMAVTSLLFIAFFVAVALVHYLLPRVLRPYFLLAASYGFFCYDPVNRPLVGVLLGATAVSWLCGLIISKVKAKPVRVLALLVTVLGGVGILVYYKYWNMLADTLGGSILSHRDNLLAPLGLSYFTFAAMSYTIDVYKRRCKVETNPLHYALFVSFFPTLTPDIIPGIEHAIQDLDSQVGHTDLVDIREAHTETDINAVPVLHYGIDFVADVAGRFFDLHQNIII